MYCLRKTAAHLDELTEPWLGWKPKRGAKLISCVKAGSRAVLAVTGGKPAPMDEIAKFFDFEEAGVLD